MDVILGILGTMVGAFVLFLITRFFFFRMVPNKGWIWTGLVLVLVVITFYTSKFIAPSINLPFFVTFWYVLTILGMLPKPLAEDPNIKKWIHRGIASALIGGVIGWSFYAEVCEVRGGKNICKPIINVK